VASSFRMCCSVLQCVAVCCSALQGVAMCCSVLQCVAVCCSVLQQFREPTHHGHRIQGMIVFAYITYMQYAHGVHAYTTNTLICTGTEYDCVRQ